MDSPHHGESIYYRYRAAYVRHWSGDLLYCTGPDANRVQENWDLISLALNTLNPTPTTVAYAYLFKLDGDFQIYELRQAKKTVLTGIIINSVADQTNAKRDFDRSFCNILMREANFAIAYDMRLGHTLPARHEKVTEEIVSLFDNFLRYQGENDKWAESGRAYFTERVRHFTSQGIPIEFCLPAFPCKSSNFDKVTGKDPDRGELLALERLHSFVEAIEKIYDAGAKLWIISDGHVFSDCIGVDDATVDSYGLQLIKTNRAIGLRRGNTDRVGFKSLTDLFEVQRCKNKQARFSQLDIPPIEHHVFTQMTTEAELCRRILMAGCKSQSSELRARIDSQDPALLALYRGFSRFMLEDLSYHPFVRVMSRSKQKKLSAKVAFEMMMRNQAYSNLVELLFPNHIRLSIHAHNNAGPKFGIQLFDPKIVRAVETLSPDSLPMISRDLLHIPTPWHNCVVKLVGTDILCVTKAKVVRDAIASDRMTGSLVKGNQIDCIPAAYYTIGPTLKERELLKKREREHEREHEREQNEHKEALTKNAPQIIVTSDKEIIASMTTGPDRYFAASSNPLTCENDYVFV
ncbi:Pyoverdine/dityrosine biosynthesis protein-domain-containing protein [Rostrohypoxylon terebratum]|nr:Pyoverdine/dityrosine biosynthesis protein-domain-containing protein [Rostrohypoxylon terebratum]